MDIWQAQLEGMIVTIRGHMHATGPETGERELREEVERAVRAVPRHRFLPAWERHNAYADMALSIGHGQTISQPFIVALMTQALYLGGTERVLEVGTGSGYQTALLAQLAAEVHSIECVHALSRQAAGRLAELGLESRVRLYTGNGWQGWEAHAPYDAIIVTAAASRLPEPLLAQLATQGRMLIPLGPPGCPQMLLRVERDAHGAIVQTPLLSVVFVPLLENP